VAPGIIDLPVLIDRMSCAPARVFKLPGGTLRRGMDADVTVFDPSVTWLVEPSRFKTKGRNTPYAGQTLQGRARCTIVGGVVVHRDTA
jgi:dihydroorotase